MPGRAEAAVTQGARRAREEEQLPQRRRRRRGLNLPAFMRPSTVIPMPPARLQSILADTGGADFPLRYIPGYTLNDQGPPLWCWAAMGESISRYYDSGSQWTRCRLANRLRGPGDQARNCCSGDGTQCNWMRTMDQVFAAIGHLRDTRNGSISFDRICEEIEQGRPICVRVTPQGNGHFVAITGVERVGGINRILVNDPARRDSIVPYDRFTTYYEGTSSWTLTYLTRREGGIGWA